MAPATPPKAELALHRGDAEDYPNTIELRDEMTSIGCETSCDITWETRMALYVKMNVFVLKTKAPGRWFIIDKSMFRCVKVNDELLETDKPCVLSDGDLIAFGASGALKYIFRFVGEAPVTQPPAQAGTSLMDEFWDDFMNQGSRINRTSLNSNSVPAGVVSSTTRDMIRSPDLYPDSAPSSHNAEFMAEYRRMSEELKKLKLDQVQRNEEVDLIKLDQIRSKAELDRLKLEQLHTREQLDRKNEELENTKGTLNRMHRELESRMLKRIQMRDDLDKLRNENRQLLEGWNKTKDHLELLGHEINLMRAEPALMEAQKRDGLETMGRILEVDLSCAVCSEVMIDTTVLDCGHSFCHYCISKWTIARQAPAQPQLPDNANAGTNRGTGQCPYCRKPYNLSTSARFFALDEVVTKIFESLGEEFLNKRRASLEERKKAVRALNRELELLDTITATPGNRLPLN